ncbi:MAG: hypothetical protein LBJ31_06260 [Treponema sp.]|jgi:hypothetical protein|nr:hypothetical protein [Treponema sp.]
MTVELNLNIPYILDMNDFSRGMSSVGQLFPAPPSYSSYPSKDSAWQGVANSFYQAGKNLHVAIKEFSDAQRKNKQTP